MRAEVAAEGASTKEPPLNFEECEKAKQIMANAKGPFAEVPLQKYLISIGKKNEKAKVLKMLRNPCKKPAVAAPLKPAVAAPLTDEECQEALEILENTSGPPFIKEMKVKNFCKPKTGQERACKAQVDACCPSANPREPLYKMKDMSKLCWELHEKTEEPSIRNSVRGAISGVLETQTDIRKCVAVMPAPKQESFQSLLIKGNGVVKVARRIEESVFQTMIQSAGPFLPRGRCGVNKQALKELYAKLPEAGSKEDDERIRGSNGVSPVYSISDFLDDEALRYSFRRICNAIVGPKPVKKSRRRGRRG